MRTKNQQSIQRSIRSPAQAAPRSGHWPCCRNKNCCESSKKELAQQNIQIRGCLSNRIHQPNITRGSRCHLDHVEDKGWVGDTFAAVTFDHESFQPAIAISCPSRGKRTEQRRRRHLLPQLRKESVRQRGILPVLRYRDTKRIISPRNRVFSSAIIFIYRILKLGFLSYS